MCNTPLELVAYDREAAEQPTTYSSVTEWVAQGIKVQKCITPDGLTQTWLDEGGGS
jgi:hypothetical protein